MEEHKYLGNLVYKLGIKIEVDKDIDKVIVKIDDKIKEFTLLEAKAFASELLLDSTFGDGKFTYHGCRWERNWCYDADITVKYKRKD